MSLSAKVPHSGKANTQGVARSWRNMWNTPSLDGVLANQNALRREGNGASYTPVDVFTRWFRY